MTSPRYHYEVWTNKVQDFVVFIPGVLGSVLKKDSTEVWGYHALLGRPGSVRTRLLNNLTLPIDAFDSEATSSGSQIAADRILPTPALLPGFWRTAGYRTILSALESVAPGRVFTFPYDWRQSNRITARLLRKWLYGEIFQSNGIGSGNRIVFVAHSMGGLVARYFAECLDDARVTTRIITIGTPYLGAAKALASIMDGTVKIGPVSLGLRELLLSFPSVAELLPVYPCIVDDLSASPRRANLASFDQRVLDLLDHGDRFHRELHIRAKENEGSGPRYSAILGNRSRTEHMFRWDGKNLASHETTDPYSDGDGTVSRISASPPEWFDDSAATFVNGRHATLHESRRVQRQICGIISSRPREPMDVGFSEFTIDSIDEVVLAGGILKAAVRSTSGSPLPPLLFSLFDSTGRRVGDVVPFRSHRHTNSIAAMTLEKPGVYSWEIRSPLGMSSAIDPITDVVWVA
ncbi:esterase/lipase family protein [Nocardia sp. NPDC060249]|uniref:esterase/lipase family protein n=1 Tax=Nocardia sp. NPDC060249 TaxID=3347082 RepID=UPI0036594D33